MVLIVCLFVVLSGLELLLWLPPFWRWRRPLATGLLISLGVASAVLVAMRPQVWTAALALLSLYRLINLLRLIENRVQTDYLYHVTRRSVLWLIGSQAVMLAAAAASRHYGVRALVWWYILAGVQIVVALALTASTERHLRTTRPPRLTEAYADRDLPTLSVALPARNESEDLEACLRTLTANTYPKLEVLVLDDCSQNKRTPEIIRSFAHDGVRFIAGQPPPDHWLAKNYAYEQLARVANGELLLFCGVDTRFEPDSLRQLVETLLQKKKTMLSVLPRNGRPGAWHLLPLLVQPARYAWELALPRRRLQRPPVLSTCWLITAEALRAAGGFKAVSRGHSPESYFARAAAGQRDGYSFLQSTGQIGVASAKTFAEQRATAIRTRYPQLHRRPELVGLLTLTEAAALLAPFALLVGSLLQHVWPLAGLAGLSSLLLLVFYARTVALTYRQFLLRGVWLLPLAALYDLGLLNYSMWQYEFGEVIWKGRNICIPLMRVIPALPAAAEPATSGSAQKR